MPEARRPRLATACAAALAVVLASVAPVAAESAGGSQLQVYAHTLEHQRAHEALALVQPLLSARGTVEVQPGDNTLVIRETREVVDRIARLLADFDHPPEALRFDIQIVRAGPRRSGISPPGIDSDDDGLSQERVAQLRRLLRYDDYRVLAEAGVTSREGDEVTYALGDTYSVSFRSGPVLAGRRVKLEGFRIVKQTQKLTDKGRRIEPRELFHATLNLWIGRSFNLVLDHDESRREALMVAISCRREGGAAATDREPAEKTPGRELEQAPGAGATGGRPAGGR